MSLRPFFAVLALLGALIIYARLIYGELRCNEQSETECINQIAPTRVRAQQQVRVDDPLIDMRFYETEREANFLAMGLPAKMAKEATRRANTIHTSKEGQRLKALLKDAAQPVELADALCGQPSRVRPRYAAMRFLVTERRGGDRLPIELQRTGQIRMEAWAETTQIDYIFKKFELIEARKDDATLMGIAAVLADQEEAAVEGNAPWAPSIGLSRWSWDTVKKKFPGIEGKCINYFALMHVAVEYALAEGGICQE